MANSKAVSEFWTGLLDWKSSRFRIELAALVVVTVVLIFWTLTPGFDSQTAWGGEVIGAWYWGLGWYKEPGLRRAPVDGGEHRLALALKPIREEVAARRKPSGPVATVPREAGRLAPLR